MIKTKIKQKTKTIVQQIENAQLSYIQFDHGNGTFSVILELLDKNNDLIETKRFTYSIDEFKIFDRLIKRIFKDEDLEEI